MGDVAEVDTRVTERCHVVFEGQLDVAVFLQGGSILPFAIVDELVAFGLPVGEHVGRPGLIALGALFGREGEVGPVVGSVATTPASEVLTVVERGEAFGWGGCRRQGDGSKEEGKETHRVL